MLFCFVLSRCLRRGFYGKTGGQVVAAVPSSAVSPVVAGKMWFAGCTCRLCACLLPPAHVCFVLVIRPPVLSELLSFCLEPGLALTCYSRPVAEW